jgi:hypothetical protein
MQPVHETDSDRKTQFIQQPALRVIIISFLFLMAFAIRLHHISRPPLDFQPIRQFMLAHNTRAPYFENLETIPEWKKEIARINKERMGFEIEAPIFDHMIISAYQMLDGEYLWIPRVLSSMFWIVGGIFLYLVAGKILSPGAAMFSIIFYLFLPFGISASRSFQPDPLMIMLLLLSFLMIFKYYEQSSFLKLIIAILVSSLAMLIKPYSIFLIFGAFISLSLYIKGIRGSLMNRNFLIFILLSPVPGAFYYISGLLTEGAFLQEHAQATFLPHLLIQSYFWKDWFAMIARVVGLISFFGALLGLVIIKKGISRSFLFGLWIGYLIYGLFFTFHIHTHDYYQLPFIPVVALSLGTPAALFFRRICSSKKYMAITGILFLILLIGFGIGINKENRLSDSGYLKIFNRTVGINPQFYKFINSDFENEFQMAMEIGKIVKHNTNTLFLTADYGRSLTYYGDLSGLPWPTSTSFKERKDRGIKVAQNEELYNGRYFLIRTHGSFVRYIPDYFIITDFDEFESQRDLKEFLYENYPLMEKKDDYLIFDLRSMSGKT